MAVGVSAGAGAGVATGAGVAAGVVGAGAAAAAALAASRSRCCLAANATAAFCSAGVNFLPVGPAPAASSIFVLASLYSSGDISFCSLMVLSRLRAIWLLSLSCSGNLLISNSVNVAANWPARCIFVGSSRRLAINSPIFS